MAEILFISEVGPGSLGGVQIHLAQVLKKLDSYDELKVSVLCRVSGGWHESGAIKILNPKLATLYMYIIRNITNLLRLDIIHFHDFSVAKHFFPIIVIRFLFRKRTYITFHGWEGKIPPKRTVVVIKKLLNKICNGSILVGDYLKKWYGLSGIVIYGGGDHAAECAATENNAVNSHNFAEKKQIAFVGRLEQDTGFLELLDISNDQNHLNGLVVDVYGGGSLAGFVQSNGVIKLHGHVDDLIDRLKSYEVVITSGYLGILEALFLGKSVISISDSSLKQDYLNIPGLTPRYLTVVNTAQQLRSVLNQVLSQPGDQTIVDQELLRRRFSWEFVVCSYLALWRKQ